MKILNTKNIQGTHTHTHSSRSRGSVVIVSACHPVKPAGVGSNLNQIAKDFSLTGSGYCSP